MANNWKSLFDPNPVEIWTAKPQKSEADQRREKVMKTLDKAIEAAKKGQAMRGVVSEKATVDDRYAVKVKAGRTLVKIDGHEYQTIHKEDLAKGLQMLRDATEAGTFDNEIAIAYGDTPVRKRGGGRKKAGIFDAVTGGKK